jgi:hypothetical protein
MKNVQQPNFRDLCSRLADELHKETCLYPSYARESVREADKALKQPALRVSRGEVSSLYYEHGGNDQSEGFSCEDFERAVGTLLARLGYVVV